MLLTMSLLNKDSMEFTKNVLLEFFWRFLEISLVGAFLSCLLIVVLNMNILSYKIMLALRVISFLAFEVLNIWLCRKSNIRVYHYRLRYYIVNISACLLYAFVSFIFSVSNSSLGSYLFCITQVLWSDKYNTYAGFLLFFGGFHLVTILLVVLAKEYKYIKYIIKRRVKREETFYLLDR